MIFVIYNEVSEILSDQFKGFALYCLEIYVSLCLSTDQSLGKLRVLKIESNGL
jgi:hypothetical protein